MGTELPPFPLDDSMLQAVEHALGGAVEIDEDGNRKLVGAEYTLSQLLDFLAGTTGEDPDAEVIDPGDPLAPEVPGFLSGLAGAKIVIDSRPRYSEHDLIAALIGEIRRLRSTELDRYAALWCQRCGWHQYQHGGPGVDPLECPECRSHHGKQARLRSVQCVIFPQESE